MQAPRPPRKRGPTFSPSLLSPPPETPRSPRGGSALWVTQDGCHFRSLCLPVTQPPRSSQTGWGGSERRPADQAAGGSFAGARRSERMNRPSLGPMTNATLNATAQSGVLPSLPGAKLGLAILSLAFILGFPGNVFVVWSALWRVHKRTVTCLLILHLALADCAVLLTAPFFLRLLSAGSWEFGPVVCKLCHYICGVSMYASISLIALMSLDRCLAVSRPFISQKIRTKLVARSLVLAIWMVSFLLAVPVIFYRKLVLRGPHLLCDLSHPTPGHLVFHNLFETLTGFVLPFAAIIWSYGVIGRRLRETRFRRKRRTNRLIALIVVAFAFFWLPFHVVNLLDVAGALSHSKALIMAGKMARPTLTALAFFSSSVNPILYAFTGGALIKSAGIGFMAKLFEGTASEVSSTRQWTGRTIQRHEEAKLEMGQDGNPENTTLTTHPLE